MTTATNLSSLQLPGYQISTSIYQGPRTAVYRGIRLADGAAVVIKVLQQSYPSFHELLQFRNQYTITQNLTIPGVVPSYGLETYGHSYALVMADFGGQSLQQYCQGRSLDLAEVLAIGIQMADILHALSQNHIIHKDIKPANILIQPDSRQIQLIDFSISSLLPRESQALQTPQGLEGTLAYLSPEQTGRMNRSIDYRSDFYSLGITLYELLTGQLPFLSSDPMELVHCHLTQVPTALCEISADIPEVVSSIILKLIAKNAEDRYQNALGLKHDLAFCLTQWKETGAIAHFELGQRDLSDRFLIPEKLYGREAAVQSLLDAFDRVADGASEFILVAGFSGIGKTAVVNEVNKPIVRQRGYFIRGKYDQFNRNIPLSAFVQALRDLMAQLLTESDVQLAHWKTQILAAVEANGQILIDVIPELVQIIGPQPAVPELSGSAAQSRFNLLFPKFIEVFSTHEHPLVIFLDDLQWADSASLQLIKLLMNDHGYLLMLGAYRDNEVSGAHPLMLSIDELKKAGTTINTLTLSPLEFIHANHLIADVLNCSTPLAEPLTELVLRKTQGNPFFLTQFLKALYEDGHIRFNQQECYWECDITAVTQQSLTDNVVEFMAQQLQKLPAATQDMLKLAACIGNQFDLTTLAIVSAQSPTATANALWKALQEGLILPTSQVYKLFQSADIERFNEANSRYRFLHDRVQQAAYSLIEETQKQTTHLTMGQRLLQNTSEQERDSQIFTIVNHLNQGSPLIQDAELRTQLAQLNFQAGSKAKRATAYVDALNYFASSNVLLEANAWQTQYEFVWALHLETAEAEMLNANFDRAAEIAEIAAQQAQSALHQVRVDELKIQFLIAQFRLLEALEVGLGALDRLGLELAPTTTHPTQLPLPDLATIAQLPVLQDPYLLAGLRVLMTISPPAYFAKPEIWPTIILTQIRLCQTSGYSGLAAYSYLLYGMLLAGGFNDSTGGYHAGLIGLKLLERFDAKAIKSKVYNLFYAHIKPWNGRLAETLAPLKASIYDGLAVGDVEWASYSAMNYSKHVFLVGNDLIEVEQAQRNCLEILIPTKQETPIYYTKIWHTLTQQLLENAANPTELCFDDRDEASIFAQFQASSNQLLLFHAWTVKTMLGYLFNDVDLAIFAAQQATPYQAAATGMIAITVRNFYHSLALCAKQTSSEELSFIPADLENLQQNQAQLAQWATFAPENFQHQYDLVEAERLRVCGDRAAAIAQYDRAIAGAKAQGFLHHEGLANELAAKFYLDWDKEMVAAGHMQAAYYCYAHWGSLAKTADLEQRYPSLLRSVLQQSTPVLNVLTTLNTLPTNATWTHSRTSASHSSKSDLNALLDFATILKASQSLAGTIQLEVLLEQLTQITLQHAGGDYAALVLPNNCGEWQLSAIATPDSTQICCESLATTQQIPVKLIQYVRNTQEPLILDDCQTHLPVIGDYFQRHQPKSALGLPILNQGQLIGVLYLQNQATRGIFSQDRLLVLNFLCTQAAISLENARLYRQAQSYAQDLEQSQLQIVQSEKMASLGNLVAGVAHEINNPIGFLNGSINNAKDYIEQILGHMALYQKYYANTVAPIQDNAAAIDLEFLQEDFPKLLVSMAGAVDRIKGISTSLRTFSRSDTEHTVMANIDEGIESTILILKYRLKANEHRPAIEVITNYGDIPAIACFPGQLNQVFMNILANAIDMFDESAQGQSFSQLQANPQIITIQTEQTNAAGIIRIRDNGKGMDEVTRARIFDHLFTTKGVGKGTGLGLAIARQIVEEKHGGKLAVQSAVGQGTEFVITLPIAATQ
jgi:predicted ATPase/signal transduction histidine kinase